MIGTTLAHYRITAKLGEGGMGAVYRAEDLELGRPVALKVLPGEVAGDAARLERFRREARAVAALRHAHIVTIHSVDEAEGVHFLTMELVEGEDLEALIPPGGMELDALLDVAVPLADALAAAHAKGVVHRDLKPSNVRVDPEAGVKVLDFGLAKLLEPSSEATAGSQLPTATVTQQGLAVGTIPYMSPEQAEGRPLDHRTDIFSLGVILYEMATGARPFQGGTALALMTSILRDEPAPAATKRPGLPARLGRLIARCLAKDPDRRIQSALEVRDELEALRQEVSTRTLPAASRLWPRAAGRRGSLATAVVAALVALIALWWALGRRAPDAATDADAPIESIAVLPLANLSGDPEQEFFADGMTEALITDLSKIGALKVISRTSAMSYKGSARPLPEIAAALGVDAVVEGSVLRSGDRVRITAQLIRAATDEHLWAESYERDLSDVLALQSELARTIARTIEVQLTRQEETLLAGGRTVDPRAHEAYLKGRHSLNLLTLDGFERAQGYLEEALAIDPGYARAYAGLGEVFLAKHFWGYLPDGLAVPPAEAAIARALELDESIAEAHAERAYVLRLAFDWAGAEAAVLRAIELNTGLAATRHEYSHLLSMLGRHDEAIEQAELAARLDPLAVDIGTDVGYAYQAARRYGEGERILRRLLELHPRAPFVEWALGSNLGAQRRYDEAIEILLGRDVPTAAQNFVLGHVYGLAGRRAEAQAILEYLLRRSEERFVPPLQIAIVLAGMGERDAALDWIERAFERRELWGFQMLRMDYFDPVRDEPRYRAVIARLSFPE